MDFDPDSGFAILRRRHNRHADIAAQPAPHGAREGKLNPNVLPLASSKAFVRLQKNRYISSASNEQGNRVITGQERCRRGDQPEPQPSPREPWHNARPSTQQSHDPHKRALWTEEQSCWAKPDSLPSLGIQKRVQARSLPCGFDRSRHRHAFLTKSFRASVSSRHDFACFSGDPLLRAGAPYRGTSTASNTASITSRIWRPSISNSGRSSMRCSSTGAASVFTSSGNTNSRSSSAASALDADNNARVARGPAPTQTAGCCLVCRARLTI